MTDRQNPYLVLAAAYLSLGLLTVLGRLAVDAGFMGALPRLRWTTIHLVTIGGLTQALFGAAPLLVGGADRPSVGGRWAQWLLLNAGYPLVLVGMTTGATTVAVAGATLVLAAVGLLLVTLVRLAPVLPAGLPRFFRTAPWFLVTGITMAFGLLLGIYGPGAYFGTLEAHVHANVWGFLALVVAGALLVVTPTADGGPAGTPGRRRLIFWTLALGATGLVVGPFLAQHVFTFSGLLLYVVGTTTLLATVVGAYRAAGRLRDARLGHVLGAYTWLVLPVPFAPLILLAPDLVPGALIEHVAITGLVFGWMLQLAMAYLPVALTATGGGSDRSLQSARAAAPRPSWLGLAAVNLGMLALWLQVAPLAGATREALATAGYGLVALGWAVFVWQLWRTLSAPSRPAAGAPAADERPEEGPATDPQI